MTTSLLVGPLPEMRGAATRIIGVIATNPNRIPRESWVIQGAGAEPASPRSRSNND